MSATKYDYAVLRDRGREVAHVFVAPQHPHPTGLEGDEIDANESDDPDDGSRTISGDVFIGDVNNGYYTIDFSLTISKDGTEGPLTFGDQEYDLSEGRCIVVRAGYEIEQLTCMTKDEGMARLTK